MCVTGSDEAPNCEVDMGELYWKFAIDQVARAGGFSDDEAQVLARYHSIQKKLLGHISSRDNLFKISGEDFVLLEDAKSELYYCLNISNDEFYIQLYEYLEGIVFEFSKNKPTYIAVAKRLSAGLDHLKQTREARDIAPFVRKCKMTIQSSGERLESENLAGIMIEM